MSELVSYNVFKRLRLSQFHKPTFWRRSTVRNLDRWEFMGGLWIGEAIGFTEFLRLSEKPDELGSLAVDLNALREQTAYAIFEALNLPLNAHATLTEVESVLGKPHGSEVFVKDRMTYSFKVGFMG